MNTNEKVTASRASYTEEERNQLIEEFHSSGLTQAAFAREWNINPKTLARWLRNERSVEEVAFCEVALGYQSAEKREAQISLMNGVKVTVSFDSFPELGGLLKEVSACLD